MEEPRQINLLVISSESNKYLKALQALRGRAEIAIGSSLDALRASAPTAEALLYWEGSPSLLQQVLPLCPNLRWVHSKSAGIENILFPELVEREITLTNARGVLASSLAEFALTGMLYFAKDLARMNRQKAMHTWEQFDVEELRGKTLGIFGYGSIGRQTAKRAKAFEMRVVAVRRSRDKTDGSEYLDEVFIGEERSKLFEQADFLLVSSALTEETRGAIGEKEISLMKKSAVILNLGRGPVIEEGALLRALKDGRIRAAVLDVFDVEPLPAHSALWSLPNVLLSPHTADHTATWKEESMACFLENFQRYAEGEELQNICDKRAGY